MRQCAPATPAMRVRAALPGRPAKPEARTACPKCRCSRSGKFCRFVPDAHCGTNRDAAVHPLRPGDGACPRHRYCRGHATGAVSNRRRVEEQEVQKCTAQRKRPLADDELADHMPPVASLVHRRNHHVLGDDRSHSGEVIGTLAPPSLQGHLMLTACSRVVLSGW